MEFDRKTWSGTGRDETGSIFSKAFSRFSAVTFFVWAVWSLATLGCSAARSSRAGEANELTAATSEPRESRRAAGNISPAAPPEYRIGLLDELEIRVRYHESLNETVKVRPDGRITLEDIGDIYVAGMTPSELDRYLTAAYSEFVHAPEVTVFVRSFAGLSIYVLGEVERPGMVELKPNMTVLQALAAANGPSRGAKMNSVILLRRGATGEMKAIRLDLNRAAIQEAAAEDRYLQPEDIIYIPKTFIANVNEFLTQIYDGLFPPFDIYLRTLREYNRVR